MYVFASLLGIWWNVITYSQVPTTRHFDVRFQPFTDFYWQYFFKNYVKNIFCHTQKRWTRIILKKKHNLYLEKDNLNIQIVISQEIVLIFYIIFFETMHIHDKKFTLPKIPHSFPRTMYTEKRFFQDPNLINFIELKWIMIIRMAQTNCFNQ